MKWMLLLLVVPMAWAQERSQARSMVVSDRGIVATSQTLASQAGAMVLARAVDDPVFSEEILRAVSVSLTHTDP